MTRFLHYPLSLIAAVILMTGFTGRVDAASFSIVYDDSGNQAIDGTIVGTGTFSYNGPPVIGDFALSSLTGVSFTADFPSVSPGGTFSTSDLISDFNISGIHVFDAGGGQFGLVFTGPGFPFVVGGSLDAINSDDNLLTHEPTSAINDPIGCCGGNGTVNLYQLDGPSFLGGDYRGLTTTGVPAPASFALLCFGLSGVAAVRVCRRRP